MSRTLRVLIVDDEPAVRDGIREYLDAEADCDVVGEVHDGRSAVAVIRSLRPDIVFLDVQMPELDGFGVVAELAAEDMPVVVFVTAYERYAIQAFDAHAIDFLLKPFDLDRFRRALDRARRECGDRRGELGHVARLIEDLRAERPTLERFVVKRDHRILLVPAEDVDSIEAAGNYVTLHLCDGDRHLIRSSVTELECKLDPKRFTRVHRSTIVRIDAIAELERLGSGDYHIRLRSGREVTLSRTYRKGFEETLGRSL